MEVMGIPENLKALRMKAGLSQQSLAAKSHVSQQLISQLERGINVSSKHVPKLARALGVRRKDIDESFDDDETGTTAVPLLAWVSAGAMRRDDVADEALGTIRVTDLPLGDWIALRVVGDSMDRVSPPDSIIFIDRKDTRLVSNALYVIADEEGNATYKRFRPGPPRRFEPVSVNTAHEPLFPDHDPVIVGRVKRTMLDTM